jgi:hypothetical protein
MGYNNILSAGLTAATLMLGATAASAATTYDNCADFTLNQDGGNGAVNVLANGSFTCAFTLVGSNSTSGFSAVNTTFTVAAEGGQRVEGQFGYSTNDTDGSTYDPFGYFINGTLFQLTTTLAAPAFQSGTFAFNVHDGDVFGYYINAVDNFGGAASASTFFNVTAVPVPASALLLLGAVGGLGAMRRRKANKA